MSEESSHLPILPNAALLVIDVQNGLFDKTIPIYKSQVLLENICRLVEQAHAASVPVIYIQHNNTSFLKNGTPGWQIHPALHPEAFDPIVQKEHGNGFEKTPLKALLDERGVKTVIVTGLVSHGCVKATSLGAKELGYRVVLVSDGHSNFHKNAKQVIEDWNREAADLGIDLLEASQIFR